MLGAAIQAKLGYLEKHSNYKDVTSALSDPKLICEPYRDAPEIYDPLVERYKTIISSLIGKTC